MDKTEQIARALKERENKDIAYIKVVVTLILIAQLIGGHIICVNIALAERKVDYRYFNLVSSLEKIHKVYIDTYDGSAYKTIEELNLQIEKRDKKNLSKKSFFKKYMKLITN